MKNEDCIFCKIANGEIVSRMLYEDDKFRVIMDLSPVTKGHALILPKEHYEDLFSLPEILTKEAFALAKKMANEIKDTLHCEGFNVIQNNGAVAGQTVFHFHIHLIPRYKDDLHAISWNPKSVPSEELDSIMHQILKD